MLPEPYLLSATEIKLAFLDKIMENDSDLIQEFLAFLDERNNVTSKSMEDPQGFIDG